MPRTPVMLVFAFGMLLPVTLAAQQRPMPLLRVVHAADTVPQRINRAPSDTEVEHAHNGWRGAIYGAVLGGIAGGVLASTLVDHMGCNLGQSVGGCDAGRRRTSFTLGSIGLGAAVGAGVGSLVGLAWPTPDDAANKRPQ